MTAGSHADRAERLARRALSQALWPPLAAIAVGVAAVANWPDTAWAGPFGWMAAGLAGASSLALIGFSALLVFDALLFRLAASYEDEWKGGAAVDDILARMRLKPTPPKTRSLSDRAAGTRRIVSRQRMALALLTLSVCAPLLAAPA
ncbi:hypothetical protein RB623_01795 [Mesorhizobium sp. LHD-90]|uniref:hypothetical protein n=1 Tax=Mesorhizobium sp. LHD-90 TaxID=3071414 RepID=UPI0027DF2333|nr:hypothetical protein [Mesorhizobium sp. LHD-90]MDQ6432783.1 hypothetical protein [Mesorhizobium sp. LHD-90]